MRKLLGYLIIAAILAGGMFLAQNYNANADVKQGTEFNKRTYVRASHILVDSEAKAKQLKTLIENGDIKFETAAQKYSSCPSGKNGGDLGYFGRGQMVKEFETAAFTLPLGAVSDPVKTSFGYHLIKVTDAK